MVQRFKMDPFMEWLSMQHCPKCGAKGRFKIAASVRATAHQPTQHLVECRCGKQRKAKPGTPAMGKTQVVTAPPAWLED